MGSLRRRRGEKKRRCQWLNFAQAGGSAGEKGTKIRLRRKTQGSTVTYTVLTRPQAFSVFTLFREKGTHSRLCYLCVSKLKFIKLSKAKKKNIDTDKKIVQNEKVYKVTITSLMFQ